MNNWDSQMISEANTSTISKPQEKFDQFASAFENSWSQDFAPLDAFDFGFPLAKDQRFDLNIVDEPEYKNESNLYEDMIIQDETTGLKRHIKFEEKVDELLSELNRIQPDLAAFDEDLLEGSYLVDIKQPVRIESEKSTNSKFTDQKQNPLNEYPIFKDKKQAASNTSTLKTTLFPKPLRTDLVNKTVIRSIKRHYTSLFESQIKDSPVINSKSKIEEFENQTRTLTFNLFGSIINEFREDVTIESLIYILRIFISPELFKSINKGVEERLF